TAASRGEAVESGGNRSMSVNRATAGPLKTDGTAGSISPPAPIIAQRIPAPGQRQAHMHHNGIARDPEALGDFDVTQVFKLVEAEHLSRARRQRLNRGTQDADGLPLNQRFLGTGLRIHRPLE